MVMSMDDRSTKVWLADQLHHAAVGFAWTALVVMVLVWISYGAYMLERGSSAGLVAHMWGVSPSLVAKIWIGALAATKLLALWFAGVALSLWIWRNRLVRSLG